MIRTAPASVLLALAVLAAMPRAQSLTFVEGASTQALSVRVVPESSPGSAGTTLLQNVEFMPFEISGHLIDQELQTAFARLDVRQGLTRIELPGGGRILYFRSNGGAQWGLLHVRADGGAAVLLQAAGDGPAGLDSPIEPLFGVARDGSTLVVPMFAGGAQIVRLDGQVFASTGLPSRLVGTGLEVQSGTVMVGPNHFYFCSGDERLWRCALADGNTPVDCSPPAQNNARFGEQMAMSGDGSTVVCLYGPRRSQSLWILHDTGTSLLLPPPPSKYELPNYIPIGDGNAHMLLNEDGTRLLYVETLSREELFLLDTTGLLPTAQITEDQIFEPWIGIHVLPRFQGPKLVLAVGDVNQMDWFQAQLQPGGATVTNLTGTGSYAQPFPAGTINPADAATTGSMLLTTESLGAGQFALRSLDLVTGAATLQQTDVLAAPKVGSALSGPADIVVHAVGGDRLFPGGSATPAVATPPGITIGAPVRGPVFSATWVELAPGLGLTVFYLNGGPYFAAGLEAGVTQICMTAAGGCFVNAPQPRYLAPGVAVAMNLAPVAVRLCLSGAGG